MTRRTITSRAGWAVLFIAFVGLLAIGYARSAGPRTPDERIQAIAGRIACPVCEGESVADSSNPTSVALMQRIKIDVRAGQMSDDEIIESITSSRDGQELLVPTASGVEALAWALPAAAFVVAVVGLTLAFRRWKRESATVGHATEADYELVSATRASHHIGDRSVGADGADDDTGGGA